MSGEMMQFPNNMKQFLDKYSFLDKEKNIYKWKFIDSYIQGRTSS